MNKHDSRVDPRDYMAEAIELISGLRGEQLYDMYDIVTTKLKQTNSPVRDRELAAVKKTIELDTRTEVARLRFIISGYKSEMAQTALPRDGYSKPNRKKV